MSYWVRFAYFLLAVTVAAFLYWLSDFVHLDDLIKNLFDIDSGADGDAKVKTVVGGSILTLILAILKWAISFQSSIAQFIEDPKAAAAKGLIGDIRSQMAVWIRRSTPVGTRLVIFIDDIERCRNAGGIDLLEAINQLLMQTDDGRAVSPVIVVVLGDIDLVALAAGSKYQDTAKASAMVDAETTPAAGDKLNEAAVLFHYGRRHLQKIVQLRFNIPSCEVSVLQEMSGKLVRDVANQKSCQAVPGGRDGDEPRSIGLWSLLRRQTAALGIATVILAHRSFWDLWLSGSWFVRALLVIKAPIFAIATVAADLAAAKVGRLPPLHYDSRSMPFKVRCKFSFGGACSYVLAFLLLALASGSYPPIDTGPPILGTMNWDNPVRRVFVGFGYIVLDWEYVEYIFLTTILVAFLAVLLLHSAFTSIYISERQLIGDYANPRSNDGSAKLEDADNELLEARAFLRHVRENAERLALINDSAYFGAAQKEVVKTLRPTPRLLKRTSNKVRLLMAILNARKLLRSLDSARTVGPGVDAATLGRWVVFEEKWPDIARLAMTHEALVDAIGAGDISQWERAGAVIQDAPEINKFLGENEIPKSDLTVLVTLRAPATSERQPAHQAG